MSESTSASEVDKVSFKAHQKLIKEESDEQLPGMLAKLFYFTFIFYSYSFTSGLYYYFFPLQLLSPANGKPNLLRTHITV